jgi:hypothetical protein
LYDHLLVNARTGQTYLLPDLVLLHVGERPSRIILRASTLSQQPILGSGCLVANICTIILSTTQTGTGMVCFSSLGSGISNSGIFGDFEDVIFFSGAFYTVSRTGQMFRTVANPTLDLPSVFLRCFHSLVASVGPPDPSDHYLVARYIVISRGGLLLLCRYSPRFGDLTNCFSVHEMVPLNPVADSGDLFRWNELNDLEGRIIFVGRGSSLSFESSQHPGVAEGVYFLDDTSFHNWRMMFNGGPSGRSYVGNDIGYWSMHSREVTMLSCRLGPSRYSPHIWVLHGDH